MTRLFLPTLRVLFCWRDVEGKVLRINNALDKAQVLKDQLLTVVHDEDTAHILRDLVGFLVVEEVKVLGQKQDSLNSS
jgi:hypothetical protein